MTDTDDKTNKQECVDSKSQGGEDGSKNDSSCSSSVDDGSSVTKDTALKGDQDKNGNSEDAQTLSDVNNDRPPLIDDAVVVVVEVKNESGETDEKNEGVIRDNHDNKTEDSVVESSKPEEHNDDVVEAEKKDDDKKDDKDDKKDEEEDDDGYSPGKEKSKEKEREPLFPDEEPENDLKSAGTYVWGRGGDGQLGIGETSGVMTPTRVKGLEGHAVVCIACGHKHTAAATTSGDVFTWGWNECGQLGQGDLVDRTEPAIVKGLALIKMLQHTQFIQVAAGKDHTVALSSSGAVYAWGSGEFGQLGIGSRTQQLTPTLILSLHTQRVVKIACGSGHTCCLTAQGQVYAWGKTANGRLGLGPIQSEAVELPQRLKALSRYTVADIVCGWNHTMCLTDSGAVFSWGEGGDGKLGHGNEEDVFEPKIVEFFAQRELKVVSLAGGYFHSAALTRDSRLYTWGLGENGQLGHAPSLDSEFTPRLVDRLLNKLIVRVACGALHTIVVDDSGVMFVFGSGEYGQLGLSERDLYSINRHNVADVLDIGVPLASSARSLPVPPTPVLSLKHLSVMHVACGFWHSIAYAEVAEPDSILSATESLISTLTDSSLDVSSSPTSARLLASQLASTDDDSVPKRKSSKSPEPISPSLDSPKVILPKPVVPSVSPSLPRERRFTEETLSSVEESPLGSHTPLKASAVLSRSESGPSSDVADDFVVLSSSSSSGVNPLAASEIVGSGSREIEIDGEMQRLSPASSVRITVSSDYQRDIAAAISLEESLPPRRGRTLSVPSLDQYVESPSHQKRGSFFSRLFTPSPAKTEPFCYRDEMRCASSESMWLNTIVPQWDKLKGQKKTHDLFMQGIPPRVRGTVWKTVVGNHIGMTPELFEIFARHARQEIESRGVSLRTIEVDLPRTFPTLLFFNKNGPFYNQIMELLAAWAQYRPDVGYVQGMSHLAGMLVMNMDEYSAFCTFINMMDDIFFMAFYRMEIDLVVRHLKVYNIIFADNMPELYKHFEHEEVGPNYYLLDWFMTMFTHVLKVNAATRVWDGFMIDGEAFLHRAALGILHKYEKELLSKDFEGIVGFLRKNPKDIPEDELMSSIMSITVPDYIVTSLARLREQYNNSHRR